LNLLEKLGFKLFADELLNADNDDLPAILAGIEEFREHLGGELSVTLLSEIGRSLEVHKMDPLPIAAAVAELRTRAGK
jgi:3-dehydroquinate synthase